ncbi:uncharacterized protein LOC116984962 [Amblyraja radiata]|uniref:uncharacterized protein LOC116984962 n=1 Tax=Amblyraja radiata TaxID=386614 RepID=UPI0014036904|nr:uncharacterized protein LOC116984962 [Amblyraja radiata]
MQISLSEGRRSWINCSADQGTWTCESPFMQNGIPGNYSVFFRLCGSEQQVNMIYHENPIFYNFTKVIDEKQLLITVMRKIDNLDLSKSDVKIFIPRGADSPLECNITAVMADKIKCVLNTNDISISELEAGGALLPTARIRNITDSRLTVRRESGPIYYPAGRCSRPSHPIGRAYLGRIPEDLPPDGLGSGERERARPLPRRPLLKA